MSKDNLSRWLLCSHWLIIYSIWRNRKRIRWRNNVTKHCHREKSGCDINQNHSCYYVTSHSAAGGFHTLLLIPRLFEITGVFGNPVCCVRKGRPAIFCLPVSFLPGCQRGTRQVLTEYIGIIDKKMPGYDLHHTPACWWRVKPNQKKLNFTLAP